MLFKALRKADFFLNKISVAINHELDLNINQGDDMKTNISA